MHFKYILSQPFLCPITMQEVCILLRLRRHKYKRLRVSQFIFPYHILFPVDKIWQLDERSFRPRLKGKMYRNEAFLLFGTVFLLSMAMGQITLPDLDGSYLKQFGDDDTCPFWFELRGGSDGVYNASEVSSSNQICKNGTLKLTVASKHPTFPSAPIGERVYVAKWSGLTCFFPNSNFTPTHVIFQRPTRYYNRAFGPNVTRFYTNSIFLEVQGEQQTCIYQKNLPRHDLNLGIVIGIPLASAILVIALILALCCFCCSRRKERKETEQQQQDEHA